MMENRTYIGPYAVCEFEMVACKDTIRACRNLKCARWKNETDADISFCPKCGSSIDAVDVEGKQPAVLLEDVESALADGNVSCIYDHADQWPGKHIWEPNDQDFDDQINAFRGDETETGFFKATGESIKVEMDDFLRHFEKELDVLRQHYGPENVEICWGAVRYIM